MSTWIVSYGVLKHGKFPYYGDLGFTQCDVWAWMIFNLEDGVSYAWRAWYHASVGALAVAVFFHHVVMDDLL